MKYRAGFPPALVPHSPDLSFPPVLVPYSPVLSPPHSPAALTPPILVPDLSSPLLPLLNQVIIGTILLRSYLLLS